MKRLLLGAAAALLGLSFVGGAGAADKKVFALVPKALGVPFYADAEKGCKEEAAKIGAECLFTGPAQLDDAEQARIVRDLITKKVSGISIAPNNAEVDQQRHQRGAGGEDPGHHLRFRRAEVQAHRLRRHQQRSGRRLGRRGVRQVHAGRRDLRGADRRPLRAEPERPHQGIPVQAQRQVQGSRRLAVRVQRRLQPLHPGHPGHPRQESQPRRDLLLRRLADVRAGSLYPRGEEPRGRHQIRQVRDRLVRHAALAAQAPEGRLCDDPDRSATVRDGDGLDRRSRQAVEGRDRRSRHRHWRRRRQRRESSRPSWTRSRA